MQHNQTVIVLDFGGQYKELIARRVRECGVYSVIKPGDTPLKKLLELNPIGIITTGGPLSVYGEESPKCEPRLFKSGIPVLGICYGFQLMSYMLGGEVSSCDVSEYGPTKAKLKTSSVLFEGMKATQNVLMSHTDYVSKPPKGFKVIAKTDNCPCGAIENPDMKLYGVQFHPEVEHTENGTRLIHNFLYNICGAVGDYTMDDYIERQVAEIREKVGNDRVILGLSGGVDSSVAAALISRAIGSQLTCIFVDHGMMRKNEADEVAAAFKDMPLNLRMVDASELYLSKLKGIRVPERKRKIIGKLFIDVFTEEAKKINGVKFLAQGTIYPDVIESGNKKAATIKSHHNVGGLPKKLGFELLEPLRGLFKDEVRAVGRKLGLPDYLVDRQPFPGPGLAVRVIGDLTREKLDILRDADLIFRQELEASGEKASQYFAVLTGNRSVGVMGDGRTYDYTLALRAIITNDFMTGTFAPLSYELLSKVSRRITNEVRGVNRVVYDITDKPPATIEWE